MCEDAVERGSNLADEFVKCEWVECVRVRVRVRVRVHACMRACMRELVSE